MYIRVLLQDSVEFGEVVHAPPSIQYKNKKIGAPEEGQGGGYVSLLFTNLAYKFLQVRGGGQGCIFFILKM